jgi:phosphoribosylformimino-5-aminoimidazole carboxamide ribonucleotide (ProFAR) isomerase
MHKNGSVSSIIEDLNNKTTNKTDYDNARPKKKHNAMNSSIRNLVHSTLLRVSVGGGLR